jgi:hypothetical protein
MGRKIGLLYYWTKYFKKNVSIMIGKEVENWSSSTTTNGEEGKVYLEKTWTLPCTNYRCVPEEYLLPSKYNYGSGYEKFLKDRQHDFVHFTGANKPWSTKSLASINMDDILDRFQKNGLKGLRNTHHFWFLTLHKVVEKLQMNTNRADPEDVVDIRNLNIPRAKLGGFPTFGMMNEVIKARTGKSTDHIESFADWAKENPAPSRKRLGRLDSKR